LLCHDNVCNIPYKIVLEAFGDFVELFQRVIFQKLENYFSANSGNFECLIHFFKFSIKIIIFRGK
jgi:hypothetical protein